MARITLAQYAAANDARMDRMEAMLSTLVAAQIAPTAPAKPKAAPKAAKPAKKAAPAPVASKVLSRTNRLAFVADNPWAQGMSTLAIAEAVVEGETVYGGWTVGAARAARIVTGEWA